MKRLGLVDLVVVLVVLAAAWSRTPVGELGARAVHRVLGQEREGAELVSFFRVDRRWERVVERIEALPPPAGGPFPEPWRSAALLVLEDPAVLDALDAAWSGDPEATLEIVAVGAEQRDRAIRRARAAGREDAERYLAHRAYLPHEAVVDADRAVEGVQALALLLDLTWPVDPAVRVSSVFGDRVHPVFGTRMKHNGVDLAVPVGTPVLAAQAGTVVKASEDARSGRYLVLEHGHGVRTVYCHLDAFEVARDDAVPRGTRIALSGNTGRSTGPHLHFGVKVDGRAIDPLPLRREPTVATVPIAGAP